MALVWRAPQVRWVAALAAFVAGGAAPVGAQVAYKGPAITLTKVADGVYVTVFADSTDAAMNGNGVVVINDADVLVIDTQDTPAAARSVIAQIRQLTSKPVRYVVNTHFHDDHLDGNQVYQEEFPGVEFISHPATREDLDGEGRTGLAKWIASGLPAEIANLEKALANGKASSGATLTEAQRGYYKTEIERFKWLLGQLRTVRYVPATLTVADSLVLRRGERTILVRFLGRGNTRGDLTVYLPNEQVLVTGDLLVSPVPYATESFPGEWLVVLDRLRATQARVVIPGHGTVAHDFAYLDQMAVLLKSTLSQACAAVAEGKDLEATRKAVNLDSLRTVFTRDKANWNTAFDAYFTTTAVERAWHEARGEAPFGPSASDVCRRMR